MRVLFPFILCSVAFGGPQAELDLVWSRSDVGDINDLVVRDDGVTIVVVETRVEAFSRAGDRIWTHAAPAAPRSLALHPSGELTVVGVIDAADLSIGAPLGQSDIYLRRLDRNGVPLGLDARVGGPGRESAGAAVAVGEGTIVAGMSDSAGFGSPGTSNQALVARFDRAGGEVWASRISSSGPVPLQYHFEDVAADVNGRGVAVGSASDGYGKSLRVTFNTSGDLSIDIVNLGIFDSSWLDAEVLSTGGFLIGGTQAIPLTGQFGRFCRIGSQAWCRQFEQGFVLWSSATSVLELSSSEALVLGTEAGTNTRPAYAGVSRVNAATGQQLARNEVRPSDTELAVPIRGGALGPGDTVHFSAFVWDEASSTFSDLALVRTAPIAAFAATSCMAQTNSTGREARFGIAGSPDLARNQVTLFVNDVPAGQTVLFLTSRTSGFVPGVGGSAGDLCLGGAIGRFLQAGQLRQATPEGRAALSVDLNALPEGNGLVPALTGETRIFQAWFRDVTGSNLSSAAQVTFI